LVKRLDEGGIDGEAAYRSWNEAADGLAVEGEPWLRRA
jgi:hypothetical protein